MSSYPALTPEYVVALRNSERKWTLERRRLLARHRSDVANRLRVLRSRGIYVRTLWSGGTWIVWGTKENRRNGKKLSIINNRIDGVFVH
jgi:hypothetical protein